jgi:hypothetical protein
VLILRGTAVGCRLSRPCEFSMFERGFACGETHPPSPSKVRKVFEGETLGLDLGMGCGTFVEVASVVTLFYESSLSSWNDDELCLREATAKTRTKCEGFSTAQLARARAASVEMTLFRSGSDKNNSRSSRFAEG